MVGSRSVETLLWFIVAGCYTLAGLSLTVSKQANVLAKLVCWATVTETS